MMDKLRIAFVGLGQISQLNVPGYLKLPNCEVVGFYDLDSNLCRKRAHQLGIDPKIYLSYEDLLNDKDVDAVEILSPHHYHAQHSIMALDAGKHVSCQKPMCTSLAQADEIIEAVSSSDRVFRVTENFIYYPPVVRAKELLDSGMIGEPSLVRFHTTRALKTKGSKVQHSEPTWRRDRARVPGGMVLDEGVHKYAVAMTWIGDIEKVLSFVGHNDDAQIEAPTLAIWKFKDRNCLGVYELTYAPEIELRSDYFYCDDYFEIHGSKGQIHITRGTGKMMDLPPLFVATGNETIPIECDSDWASGFNEAARDFVDGVLHGHQPSITAEFGKKTIEMAFAIYQASESQSSVAL